jgi:hypothetical protein
MEHEAALAITTKATFAKEPKWTIVMAKKVRHVVSRVVETLANAPKQKECKFNLCFTSFEAKEGETEKELMQRLNTKLLQGRMRLRAKVVAAMQQRHVITRTSALTASARPSTVLLKFATNEDHQATL